jgi:DnaK suppressor protein
MSTSTTIADHDWLLNRREALHRLLRAQQEVLRGQCRSLRETPPREATDGADDEERAAQELEVGLDIALLEMRSRQIQEIETALHLLEAGGYGHCVDCREPILASRLHARPFAVRCRTCQEELEGDAAHESRDAASFYSRPDWAPLGSAPWPGSRSGTTTPSTRRRHAAAAVSVARPQSHGGVSP